MVRFCKVQREEDEERRYDEATVQGCRDNVVVLQPPPSESSLDVVVEEDTDSAPAQVDVHCGRGQQSRAAKDDGNVNVTPD